MLLTPARAVAEPALLGPYFAGPSWDRWRAILKAAYAETLDAAELALFRAVAGNRDPPTRPVRELWVVAGRRSGKDSIASAIATVAALGDHRPRLRPGERAAVMCLACDREQAKIVHRYIAGHFAQNEMLKPLVDRETDHGLELTNGVEIVVATNSYRAVRGRTILCAIFDEVAYWRDEASSANPAEEVYNAIAPGLATLPGSLLLGISTPYRRSGLLFGKWRAAFGQNDDDVLVVHGATPLFNPNIPQSIIDDALKRDPEAARAEWLGEWRSDLSDFLDRELIDTAVEPGVVVRPHQQSMLYRAFADPSGGRGDAFTCAIAHAEGTNRTAVLDALYERRAPFDPSTVVAEIADLLRQYRITEVTGDRYAAQWVVEAFRREGIRYIQSERDRSAIYLDALPMFTAGRVRLLDDPRLVHQLIGLERRTSRSGKDRVDHGPNGSDDAANAAAGALVLVARKNGWLDVKALRAQLKRSPHYRPFDPSWRHRSRPLPDIIR
ncbi:MAG: terminase [Alphaproteobacteria bacterium]|nr:terminase [Alphaproteobacteria bacterium]